jgi:uncharacterized membrane protein
VVERVASELDCSLMGGSSNLACMGSSSDTSFALFSYALYLYDFPLYDFLVFVSLVHGLSCIGLS